MLPKESRGVRWPSILAGRLNRTEYAAGSFGPVDPPLGIKTLAPSDFSLMPNHFHFVIESSHHQSLSQFMQWLLTAHVRRYHQHYRSSGHVRQGPIQSFSDRAG